MKKAISTAFILEKFDNIPALIVVADLDTPDIKDKL